MVFAAFAVFVALTGGIDTRVAGVAVRSRSWERPAMLGLFFALWALFRVRARLLAVVRGNHLVGVVRGLHRAAPVVAVLWAGIAAVVFGTFAAGGSDSQGYVSQAALFAKGRVTDTLPSDPAFAWPEVAVTFTPLGYTRDPARRRLSPIYPPGFPLAMAPLALLHRDAVFLVVPFCAALAVWCCWRLGIELGEPAAGAMAAMLLALSPTFLLQAFQPMSDVPATASWLGALLLARGHRKWSAAAAGLTAALAIMIRPNLAPLVLLVAAAAASGPDGTWKRALACLTFATPGVVALGLVQQVRFGSPLASGYGSFGDLFSTSNVVPNLQRYPRWMAELHTPFVWLWLAAPVWIRRTPSSIRPFAWTCYMFAAAVVLAYLPYVYFQPHEWSYTRFLLPAIPVMLLLGTALVMHGLRRMLPVAAETVATLAGLGLAAWLLHVSVDGGVFQMRRAEQKYPAVGAFVRERLPPSAIVLAAQHSGSIRYYSDRLTLRWDLLDRAWLDAAVAAMRGAGREPFVALDPHEDELFRERFRSTSQRAVEQLVPIAVIHDTRIYRFR